MRINLGSSDGLIEGWTNCDIVVPANAAGFDFVQADLRQRWPWPDSSVDEIRAWDIVEHIADHVHTMNEAWRVLRNGGVFEVKVPSSDGRGADQDPDHKSKWNPNSWRYYCSTYLRPSAQYRNPVDYYAAGSAQPWEPTMGGEWARFAGGKGNGFLGNFRMVRSQPELCSDLVCYEHVWLAAIK